MRIGQQEPDRTRNLAAFLLAQFHCGYRKISKEEKSQKTGFQEFPHGFVQRVPWKPLPKFDQNQKYFLGGYKNAQEEIENFIGFCKKNENSYGYLTQNFFKNINFKKAQFVNGPLANIVFEIASNKEKYLNIILGKREVKIRKNFNFIYLPA